MAGRAGRPHYRPLSAFVVRAPLLPVERYQALAERPAPDVPLVDLAKDPLVRSAIDIASPDLLSELERPDRPEADRSRLGSSLLRYLIRMSTRPTPFGLFAGLGVGTWDTQTSLLLDDRPRDVRIRPDMGWLTRLVLAAEADPALRQDLAWRRNPAAFERDGRLHLPDRSSIGSPGMPDVSVRLGPVVDTVLDLTRRSVAYPDLVLGVLARTPGATAQQVDRLLATLCRLQLLISDLRPPLTGDPARHVVASLSGSEAGGELARRLGAVLVRAATVERDVLGDQSLAELRVGLRAVRAAEGGDDVVQVDSGLPLAARGLSDRVAGDAVRAVDILLRTHPSPGGPRHLAGYRAALVARYGSGRRVPLLQLLDPRFGLGPPGPAHAGRAQPQPHTSLRSDLLFELALMALREGRQEHHLTDDELERLTTWAPEPARLPISLELSAFLVARSAAAVDKGEYLFVVGPNLGAQAAGRGLGRFGDLAGPEAAALLREIVSAEHEVRGRSVVDAELVYLPTRFRSANVTVRPAVRGHEIALGVRPGVSAERTVPAHELEVWEGAGRLRLWWTANDCEVVVSAGHMLNPNAAPPLARFLHEIGSDTVTPLIGFDWGRAASLPALPRLQVGRIVLRPAQWRGPRAQLRKQLCVADRSAFPNALRRWRDAWRVPEQVYLSQGDNRLLLDLDDPAQAEQLREELRRGRIGDLVLHEALPAPSDAWLHGPDGHYLTEIVVPLVQREAPPDDPVGRPGAAIEHRGVVDSERRPGSDWLYVTLRGPRAGEDELISGPLRDLIRPLVEAGDCDAWFFLRYSDPQRHVRLRLHGDPDLLRTRVQPVIMAWATGLIGDGTLSAAGIEVYEREVDRYGGPDGIALAEAVFAADSAMVSSALSIHTDLARDELALVSIDRLLYALGMDARERLRWYRGHAPMPVETGQEHRRRGRQLRGLFGRSGLPEEVHRLLDEREAAIAPVADALLRAESEGRLTAPVSAIARSLVHLHCNRLGIDSARERLLIGLLHRIRMSLDAAPLDPT